MKDNITITNTRLKDINDRCHNMGFKQSDLYTLHLKSLGMKKSQGPEDQSVDGWIRHHAVQSRQAWVNENEILAQKKFTQSVHVQLGKSKKVMFTGAELDEKDINAHILGKKRLSMMARGIKQAVISSVHNLTKVKGWVPDLANLIAKQGKST